MFNLNNSPEIVTQKELEPVLKSKSFDSETFLRLYNEWKITKDSRTFSILRKMHEDAGYNNKNIVFGAEQEMQQIAAIIQEYQDNKTQIKTAVAIGTVATAQSVNQSNNGIIEIKESLKEITPANLESAIWVMNQIIEQVPEGQDKATLRGVHGAVIFDIFRSAGHNLFIDNRGQVIIIPKPGTDVANLQEKLQTLINTNQLPLESLRLGMLYSSPAFKEYIGLKQINDKDGKSIIDPTVSTIDFINYLDNSRKTPDASPDIVSIIQSEKMLQWVDMKQAIQGFKDMGQVDNWVQQNPVVLQQAITAIQENPIALPVTTTPIISRAPSEPNTTLTGKIAGDGITGGHVTGVVGDATSGLVTGIGDIMSLGKGDPIATLGIGAALIYGVYKAFQKGGFFGWLGMLFGAGAINNIEKIMWRLGVSSLDDAAEKAKKLADKATNTVNQAVNWGNSTTPAVVPAVVPTTTPKNSIDISSFSEQQKNAFNKLNWDSTFVNNINSLAESNKKSKKSETGNFDDYMKFIFSDKVQWLALDKLIYNKDPKTSVFSNEGMVDMALWVPNNLDNNILKSILRQYLIGEKSLVLISGKTQWQKEKEVFEIQYSSTIYSNKTLSDITKEIHK